MQRGRCWLVPFAAKDTLHDHGSMLGRLFIIEVFPSICAPRLIVSPCMVTKHPSMASRASMGLMGWSDLAF